MSVGQTQEHEHEVQQENKAEKDDKELQKLAQTEAIKISLVGSWLCDHGPDLLQVTSLPGSSLVA